MEQENTTLNEKVNTEYDKYYELRQNNAQYKYSSIVIMSVPKNEKIMDIYVGLTEENNQYKKQYSVIPNVAIDEPSFDAMVPNYLQNKEPEQHSYMNQDGKYNLHRTYELDDKIVNTNLSKENVDIIEKKQQKQNERIKQNTKTLVHKIMPNNLNNAAFVDSVLFSFLSGVIGGIILTIMFHFIK